MSAIGIDGPPSVDYPILNDLDDDQTSEIGDIQMLLERLRKDNQDGTAVIDYSGDSEMRTLIDRVERRSPEIFATHRGYIWHVGDDLDYLVTNLEARLEQQEEAEEQDSPPQVEGVPPSRPFGYNMTLYLLDTHEKFFAVQNSRIEGKMAAIDKLSDDADEIEKLLSHINSHRKEGVKKIDFKDKPEIRELIDAVEKKFPGLIGEVKEYSWKEGKEVEGLIESLQTKAKSLGSKAQREIMMLTQLFQDRNLVTDIVKDSNKKTSEEIEHSINKMH